MDARDLLRGGFSVCPPSAAHSHPLEDTLKLMAMGRLKLVNDEGIEEIVEVVGLIITASPQELRASAHLMYEDVELREAPLVNAAGTNLVVGVVDATERLREAVAALREKYGRDVVRSLPWGPMLDAMDAKRTELHPNDVPSLAEVA